MIRRAALLVALLVALAGISHATTNTYFDSDDLVICETTCVGEYPYQSCTTVCF